MEDETDYLIPEIFYLLVFKNCPVVIRHFTYQSKLDSLKKTLNTIYENYDLEVAVFSNNMDNIEFLLDSYKERNLNGKRRLVVISHLSKEFTEALAVKKIPFLAIESGAELDYVNFDQIAIYEKKKGVFILTFPDDILEDCPLLAWCRNQFKTMKEIGVEKVVQYFVEMYQNAHDLIEIASNYSDLEYYEKYKIYTAEERSVIRVICSNHFDVNLESILPANDEVFFNEFGDKTAEILSAEHEKQNLLITLGQIQSDHPDFYYALVDAMRKIPCSEPCSSPNEMFVVLKTRIWQKFLPLRLLEMVLLAHVKEHLKGKKVSEMGLSDLFKGTYTKMVKIFAGFDLESKDYAKLDEALLTQEILGKNITSEAQRIPIQIKPLTSEVSPCIFDESKYLQNLDSLRKKYPNDAFSIKQLNAHFEQKIKPRPLL
jgi:hypothetical protein